MARHGTRYLGVLRGNNQTAKARLLQYLAGDIEPTYARPKNPKRTTVYWVRPFGFDLPAANKVRQPVRRFSTPDAANLGNALIQGYAFGPPSASDQLILKGFLAPRVAITFNRASSGTRKTSQLTGQSYKAYSGDTVIYPFGAGTSAKDKDESAVFKVIFQRAKAANVKNTCSFVPGTCSV
jgi:hypothetical protein